MPPALQDPVRAEVNKAPGVRKWIEDSPSQMWALFGHQARLGLSSIGDEDLVDWSTVLQEDLAAKDAKNCAAAVRSLASFPDESENFIPMLANGTPPRLIPKLGKVLVKAAEAEIIHTPRRPWPTIRTKSTRRASY